MRLLAYDLSTSRGTIAMVDDGNTLCAYEWANDRRTSAPFFLSLHQIVKEYGPPEMIVIGLGPGSYTGTRIAISAGIGLQTTTSAMLAGISSLSAVSDESEFYVIGDAKRASFFVARITGGRLSGEPELLSEGELSARIAGAISGPIYTSDELPQFGGVKRRYPSAQLLCARARTLPQSLTSPPLVPIYLRDAHITTPRRA